MYKCNWNTQCYKVVSFFCTFWTFYYCLIYKLHFVRKDMNVNGHERLFYITLRHKLKSRNSAFIAVLHFGVTVGSSTVSITHNLECTENLVYFILFYYKKLFKIFFFFFILQISAILYMILVKYYMDSF